MACHWDRALSMLEYRPWWWYSLSSGPVSIWIRKLFLLQTDRLIACVLDTTSDKICSLEAARVFHHWVNHWEPNPCWLFQSHKQDSVIYVLYSGRSSGWGWKVFRRYPSRLLGSAIGTTISSHWVNIVPRQTFLRSETLGWMYAPSWQPVCCTVHSPDRCNWKKMSNLVSPWWLMYTLWTTKVYGHLTISSICPC